MVLLTVGLAIALLQKPVEVPVSSNQDLAIEAAFRHQRHNVRVRGHGIVMRVLADDLKGSRHQRFQVELSSGHTLLIAHNIDLAPRIQRLKKGDRVEFSGEYEYNPKGGIIHWTHHDPKNRHPGGWIKHQGVTDQ